MKVAEYIRGDRSDLQPVWIMGQLTECLPEFRQLLETHGYLKLLHTPQLACDATLCPLSYFNLDIVSLFGSVYALPEALGMPLATDPETGKVAFEKPLSLANLGALKLDGLTTRLSYVADTLRMTRRQLRRQADLLGYAAAPWTLMSLMIGGGSPDRYPEAQKWLYAHHDQSRKLVDLLTKAVVDFCVMLVKNGVQILYIFDYNAHCLTEKLYRDYFADSLRNIREGINREVKKSRVPIGFYSREARFIIKYAVSAGYDIIGINYTTEPMYARMQVLPSTVTFQGNLDPCALFGSAESIGEATGEMFRKFQGSRFIAGLGDDVVPGTPLENVEAFINAWKMNSVTASLNHSVSVTRSSSLNTDSSSSTSGD